MGLLDNLMRGTGDPEKDRALSQGILQAGLSLLASKGNFGSALGQAGMAGVQGYQGAQDRQFQQQDRQFQQSQRQMQMEQLKRQQQLQQQQDAWRQSAVSPQMQASQAALGGGGGPTMANAAKTQAVDPNRQMLFEAMQAGVVDPQTYIQSLQPKAADYKVVGDALLQVGPSGVKEAYRAPVKPESDPASVREYLFAKNREGYKGTFEQWELARRRAGASSVNIDRAPPGYRWEGPGKLGAIPGGPADKLPEKQQGQVIGVQNLRDAIGEYRSQLDTHSKADVLSPAARAEMGTKYQNMMLQAKEAYNLGVLNGPDMKVLESVITNPMSINGLMTPRRSLDRQAAELDRIMSKMAGVASQTRPRGAAAAPVGIDPSAIDAELRRRGQ